MSLNIPNKIIIHCSATQPEQDIDVATIERWHKKNGWRTVGYHYVIKRDGTVQVGRPPHHIGAHTYGHNKHSLGVCMVGGVDADLEPEDNFTVEQYDSLRDLITELCVVHEISQDNIHGHYEFANKACPSFDVEKKLEEWSC